MKEPSVLDYVKAKLMPWRGPAPKIPPLDQPEPQQATQGPVPDAAGHAAPAAPDGSLAGSVVSEPAADSYQLEAEPVSQRLGGAVLAAQPVTQAGMIPWRALAALLLALLAQRTFEPSADRNWVPGVILYILAAALLLWSYWKAEFSLAALPEDERHADPLTVKTGSFVIGLALSLVAFVMLGGNQFTTANVLVWAAAVGFICWSLWLPDRSGQPTLARLQSFVRSQPWSLRISPWTLLLLAASALAIFFRVYHIQTVTPEMVSDHAEKLLDIWDVLHGQTRIFFPRNTGREAMQMYLTAGIILLLHTGYSHLSLKIGTVLAGLLTLPYIYLLGKELGSRRIGLLAFILAGIAYWPNVISRVGLRFPLYPLFVAPTLYYLVRGLRTSRRNDFILAGIALGIGLHGYTPIRILPFVVVAAVAIYLLHRQSKGARRQAVVGLAFLALIAFILFLPLFRYALSNPEIFAYRSFTRLGSVERPLPGPVLVLFLQNLWNAMTMFFWSDGSIWVNSIPYRPALDIVSATLLLLGMVLLAARYLRRRHWLDLFMLVSVPLLLMPSILSLAFPAENPAPNRMGGAIVPVFLIVAVALDGLLGTLQKKLSPVRGQTAAWVLAVFLILWSSSQNFDLVFRQYYEQYAQSAWNTSEMGAAIHDFAATIGSGEDAYTVAFPYWVDTRLDAMVAGYTTRDSAITLDKLDGLQDVKAPMLFLVKNDDTDALQTLNLRFPQGWVQEYQSKYEGKNFWMYFVPPRQ